MSSCKRYFRDGAPVLLVRCALIAISVVCVFTTATLAQADRPLTWEQDLSYLEQLSPAEAMAQYGAIKQIRTEVEQWLKLHPNSDVRLLPLLENPTNPEQVMNEVHALHKAVEEIVKSDSTHPFHLGQTEVNVTATVSSVSPVSDSIDQQQIREHNATNVAKAIEYLPGVEIQHLASNRDEAAFMIRGFSSNGQVPIYLDGIPMYVPYDGYIDLNRFLTSDLAEVEVSKGYSSPLLGPNALGGSVNLVTREPARKFEGDMSIGTGSGNGLLSSLNVGSRWNHFFVQGSVDWSQADYIPMSGNFHYPAGGYNALTPGAPGYVKGNVPYKLDDEMNNSYSRDEKYSGRIGWTPKESDEYVFSYINQKGQKGVPLYMGADSAASFKNFWKWPYWNKDSYYFNSTTALGDKSSIKTRVYYDQFRNSIDMYDNSTYTTMNNYTPTKGSGSEISKYDDHTDGASTEFATRLIPRNAIGASFFFKDDTHHENGIYAPTSANPLVIPDKVLRDQQTSFGLQDVITITSRLRATVGFSADHINGMQAETYNGYNQPTMGTAANTVLLPYQCAKDPSNTSYSGCTDHSWRYNPQVSATYALDQSTNVFVTFADRGRFPTLKQRYSSGMGSALPNPDLKAENSQNWNIGVSRTFSSKLSMQAVLFHSRLHDAIESALVPDTNGLCPSNNSPGHCSQNINIGKETHEGVEFEYRSRPTTGVSLSQPLVLPTGIPKHSLVGNATVLLPYHVSGLVTARYQGGITLQDTSYASTSPLYAPHGSAFGTMDLGASVPIRERFTAQAGVKNLFDRCYYYTAGYPEAGRNWYMNLRYHF